MASVDSSLALELRIRLLEAILNGTSDQPFAQPPTSNPASSNVPASHTLNARSSRIQAMLNSTVKESSSLAAFVRAYDKNLPFLVPGFVLGQPGSAPPDVAEALSSIQTGLDPANRSISKGAEENEATRSDGEDSAAFQAPLSALALPPQAQAALLLEAESELQVLERTLAECKVLDERDVSGAGQLALSQSLAPTLKDRWKQHERRKSEIDALEQQLSAILDAYTDYVRI
ncbi:hypothetical protein OC846_005670 [Tilletia horrida]|uniref:Uncharacterized protein n=1 Tax=Tilletia horrida TaxID=155126 RepID=A0AAN6JRH2_9BASI|nr:hypothetical protein OC846_005670 [Tilletia horrida]